MTSTLVLLRHGESEWNAKNLFTGWVDVDLNEKGAGEAQRGGELLVESGLLPQVVHTSLLRRAIRTAEIALHAADRHWIETKRSWRLNERHYGALAGQGQGRDTRRVRRGAVHDLAALVRRAAARRRSTPDNEFANFHDPRYAESADRGPAPDRVREGRAAARPSCTGTTRSCRISGAAR